MDIKKSIKDSVDNVRDAAEEAMHRSTADAERARGQGNPSRMRTAKISHMSMSTSAPAM